jgi:periplasmic divalent cation tolerance protein
MVRPMSTTALIVLCTCPDQQTAEHLASALVERQLAACVNILPGIRSFYRWEGRLQQDDEIQLVIKASQKTWPRLEQFIQQQHPYEVPEILAIPVTAGLPDYLKWLEDACE